jgi:mRNA interferase RelE/StbE
LVFRIEFSRSALKFLKGLAKKDAGRIVQAIEGLSLDPRPNGCKKLKGTEGYRIRIGDYRVVYSIEDSRLLISVVKIGNRKDIYEKK